MVSEWLIEEQISSENSMQFGGENTIIELDESCFFKRKSNKGRARKNIWVFGFVERISGRFFAEVVQKRDANTLIPIIEKRINLKTELLITDEWRSYLGLSK